MPVSIVCLLEGWVVAKGPRCQECYWYEPGSERQVKVALPGPCDGTKPWRAGEHPVNGGRRPPKR
jgi:hypothetical protein